jgi:glycosyltransferase involved in cell wall biosynthesis
VRSQSYDDIEYIVIDGASTDSTVDVLRNMRGLFDTFLSEKDNGIYDAMNKGIARSTGEWLYFLNCGDILFDHSVIGDLIETSSGFDDIIHGDTVNLDTGQIHKFKPDHLSWAGMTFDHQAALVRSKIYKEHPYDTSYRINGDFHFFSRCRLMGKSFRRVERIFCQKPYSGGVSDDLLGRMRERYRVCKSLYPSKPIEDQLFLELMRSS